jgi:hypothetical protein
MSKSCCSVSKRHYTLCVPLETECAHSSVIGIVLHDIVFIPIALGALECCVMCRACPVLHENKVAMHWSDDDNIKVYCCHWITHVFLG